MSPIHVAFLCADTPFQQVDANDGVRLAVIADWLDQNDRPEAAKLLRNRAERLLSGEQDPPATPTPPERDYRAEARQRWEQTAQAAYDSIADMVAALNCDYERLQELRDERDEYIMDEDANTAPDGPNYPNDSAAWEGEFPDEAEELRELEAQAGECSDQDEARQRIHEDVLSIEVRSDWVTLQDWTDSTPGEFQIALTLGGPTIYLRGELDGNQEPYRAWLEVSDGGGLQDWTRGDVETLLAYARCFSFEVYR